MIADRLERLVEEMVDKGVIFDDAVHEFEKRFISRVLTKFEGSLTKTADALAPTARVAAAPRGSEHDNQ